MTRKNLNLLVGAIFLLISFFISPSQKNPSPQIPSKTPSKTEGQIPLISPKPLILSATDSATLVKVTRIVDGDTIEIEGGIKIRYIGINTPETVAPNKPVSCFGHEASDKNKELVLGKEVRLEKDVSETDRYGRLLRYVYVKGPERPEGVEWVFVNDFLVKSGYAQVSTYPPDVKYQNLFLESQADAKENNLGLWGKCY